MATMREIASWSLCTKCTKNELFNEKKRIVMIRHIELVDRKTEITYADKYVDEEQYAEYRRLSIDGDFYVRIVEE